MMRLGILIFLSYACLQVSANYDTELEKRGSCPMHYVTGPNDVCYRFAEDYKTFLAARKQCETEGAQLVHDQSDTVYRFVQQTIEANPKRPKIAWIFGKISKIFTKWDRGYWIGARKRGGVFRWLDGKPAFGHWLAGMPDNGRLFLINWINEDCLMQLESWNGWNDASCEKKLRYVCERSPIDPCDGVTCSGRGKCAVHVNTPVCLCDEGWGGMRCEKSKDPCEPNPCSNGGKCYANAVGVRCRCVGHFSGKRCEGKCRFVVTKEGMPEKADVEFLLDGSTSVSRPDFVKSLKFVAQFVNKLKLGEHLARVGLIQFSHKRKEEFTFADSVRLGKGRVKNKILHLDQLTGGTATGRALEHAMKLFHEDRRTFTLDAAKYVIVLTDGQSHQENIIRVIVPQVIKMGVKILTVGIGPAVDGKELLLLTGGHADRVFSVDSFDRLNAGFLEKIIEKMCD